MKRLYIVTGLLLLVAFLYPTFKTYNVLASDLTVKRSIYGHSGNKMIVVSASWSGHATSGTFTTATIPKFDENGNGLSGSNTFHGYVTQAVFNPAATPTDNYDVELRDEDGSDVLRGQGYNRDQTNSELIHTNTYKDFPRIDGPLSIYIDGNTKGGAGGKIKLWIKE